MNIKCKYYINQSTLICGSTALKHWLPKYNRTINDLDFIGYKKDFNFNKYGGIDSFETTDNFVYTNYRLKIEFIDITNCPSLQSVFHSNQDITYLDLNNLLILKNAHKHFYLGKYKKSFKHLMDYSYILSQHVRLSKEEELISNEYRSWLISNVYDSDERLLSFPKLNKTKEQFFTEHVKYYYPHDDLHKILAIKQNKPAYEQCLTDQVMFSNKKFIRSSEKEKINMVLEEAFVLACERCLIPLFKGDTYLPAVTPIEAFKYALVRVCTNITSGPFRDFATDHFNLIYNEYFLQYHTEYYLPVLNLLEE